VISRNVTFKQSIETTPFEKTYGIKKDVSKFLPFGRRAYMHLNKVRREKGRHAPKAVEAVNLGFATDCNTSGYKLYIEGTGKILISNQVRFDENLYPYRNSEMVSQHMNDITVVDVMSLYTGNYEWIHFTPEIDLGGFEKIHSGGSSDSYILCSTLDPRIHLRVKKDEFFKSLLNKHED
jgi:hypothetical protein